MRRKTMFLLFALLGLAQPPSWAQGPAVGSEFQVNVHTTSNQIHPSVGASATGAFVVVWESYGQDGSQEGVFARRYDSTGMPLDPVEFQVNTYTADPQYAPVIGVTPSGGFVVVWVGAGPSNGQVLARRFDSSGAPLDPAEFAVDTYSTHGAMFPSIAVAPSGGFTIVWMSRPSGGSFDILGRRFDSGGNVLDPAPFRVNDAQGLGSYYPSIDVGDSGDFVVVWQTNSAAVLLGRRFDSAGSPLGASDFQVNTYAYGYNEAPAVGILPAGGFVVAWAAYQSGGGGGVVARRFDASGIPLDASEFSVGDGASIGYQGGPSIGVGPQGDFVVAWDDSASSDPGYGVFGRRFSSTGTPLDPAPFQVNTYTPYDQYHPSVSLAPTGDFVVAWSGDHQDGDYFGVFAQRFAAPSCSDLDGDGICDGDDIVITHPAGGEVLTCPARSAASRPTIIWDPGNYDGFRAMISWDSGFADGSSIASGPVLLKQPSWQPTRGQWNRACRRGSQGLHIRVYGEDLDATPGDPAQTTFSNVVQVSTSGASGPVLIEPREKQ